MEKVEEQQYCLRWNNFQANFTSQFEALRDDEDFTDVTIACEGQKLQAHRVVLSACSPYFKEIFKANPCSHPIIFMRDVEAHHVTALLEFMYAGEVNIAQAQLSAFLKTAESLKIRGLTDSPTPKNIKNDTLTLNPKSKLQKTTSTTHKRIHSTSIQVAVPTTVACSSTVTSSQDDNATNIKLEQLVKESTTEMNVNVDDKRGNSNNSANFDEEDDCLLTNEDDLLMDDDDNDHEVGLDMKDGKIDPKLELGDYLSDDEGQGYYAEGLDSNGMGALLEGVNFQGGMEIIPQSSNSQGFQPTTTNKRHHHTNHRSIPLTNNNSNQSVQSCSSLSTRLHSLDPRPCDVCGRVYSNLSNLRQHMKLIHYPTHVNCTMCHKPFKTDLYLRRHMSTAHGFSAATALGGGCTSAQTVGASNSEGDIISIEDILSGQQAPLGDSLQSGSFSGGTMIGRRIDGSVGVVARYRGALGTRYSGAGKYNLRS